MEHLPWLLDRTVESGGVEPCGHALMASCPPESFTQMAPEVPFGHNNSGGTKTHNHGVTDHGRTGEQPRTWDLAKPDLATLMDLSQKLNLEGEITPVMAWGMVVTHPGVNMLRMEDFRKLADELVGKVRCYGYVDSRVLLGRLPSASYGAVRVCLLTFTQVWFCDGGVRGSRCVGECFLDEIGACTGILTLVGIDRALMFISRVLSSNLDGALY